MSKRSCSCDKDYDSKKGYDYDKKGHGRDYDWREHECKCTCGCGKERDCVVCKTMSPCPKKILVECGTPGGMMQFNSTGQIFTAAYVTVDTSCFSKPVTDIYFSSQVCSELNPTAGLDSTTIDVIQQDAEVVLLYELVCRRNGGSEITIGSWTFRRFLSGGSITLVTSTGETITTEAQDLQTCDTFSFNKCICSSPCQGCIDYFVRVTAQLVSTNSVTTLSNANATVAMGQLVVKIQEC
ncbi:DUF4489 domain-containing protein [Vallitalea okinawensis]|uniref:DUF4489 domain-containing protein n=1 Tax=Vallitalea okinawensis TaxID=2078660 RepID=UPI000CFD0DFC|nr:DUF4489 domain-containing protein [Vallitalea okinawensis]